MRKRHRVNALVVGRFNALGGESTTLSRGRLHSLDVHPKRGTRTGVTLQRGCPVTRGRQRWNLHLAVGPLSLGMGPGVPLP